MKNFVSGFFIGLLLLGGILVFGNHPKEDDIELNGQVKYDVIQVQVDGAVVNPGVYLLQEGSRVLDALAAAGGLLPQANPSGINLAASLYDMQRLDIPYIADATHPPLTNDDGKVSMNTPVPTAGSEPDGITQITIHAGTKTPDGYSTDSCPDEVVGDGIFVWPVENHFLSGNDYSSSHPAIDISAGEGAPVYAADSGMIRMQGNDISGYGNIIEIDHGNGYSTVYAHLSGIEVKAGQVVCTGQWIGAAGSTGNSTGAHLHFEVIRDGAYIDPWSVLPAP